MLSEDSKDSKDFHETSLHKKSNNIEIMISNETDEIIEKLFESPFAKISRRIKIINERKQSFL